MSDLQPCFSVLHAQKAFDGLPVLPPASCRGCGGFKSMRVLKIGHPRDPGIYGDYRGYLRPLKGLRRIILKKLSHGAEAVASQAFPI